MDEGFRHFVAIVEAGSFTAAARRLHITQPALSASIKRLEEQLGAPLLSRGRHGAELLAVGKAVLPHARAVLASIEDACRAVGQIEGLVQGEVRIGSGATVCTYWLPPLLSSFRSAFPGVRLFVREATTDDVLADLDAGRLDLGIVTTERGEPWFVDELLLVKGPEDRRRSAPFVTLPVGATTRELLDRFFPEAEIAMELSSIAAIKGHVRAGVGRALVSRRAVEHDLASRRLEVIDDPRTPVLRPFRIVHRGLDRLAPAAAEVRRRLLHAGSLDASPPAD